MFAHILDTPFVCKVYSRRSRGGRDLLVVVKDDDDLGIIRDDDGEVDLGGGDDTGIDGLGGNGRGAGDDTGIDGLGSIGCDARDVTGIDGLASVGLSAGSDFLGIIIGGAASKDVPHDRAFITRALEAHSAPDALVHLRYIHPLQSGGRGRQIVQFVSRVEQQSAGVPEIPLYLG